MRLGGRRAAIVAGLVALAVLMPGARRGVADEGVCRGVRCSGHGMCMAERDVPFCLCDDGYAANALACERAEEPDTRARRRSPATAGRIVYLASHEAERGPAWVGRVARPRPGEPRPLADFLTPGEMWCSDFVSWVYRAAGVPFTGGYEGGWRLSNNFAIRRWFQRRGLWVDRESEAWSTFEPQAGDYIRMHTRSGHGHSGIVRYTTRAGVLYTVEGNVGNRVRLRRYPRFRERDRIDGFGVLIDAERRLPEQGRAARPGAESPAGSRRARTRPGA